MSKITIKNFDPVKECEFDVDDFMLFIGDQATGKSTIAKCIYFFKLIRDEVMGQLRAILSATQQSKHSIYKRVRNLLCDLFENTHYLKNAYLRYEYEKGIEITITLNGTFDPINIELSQKLDEELKKLLLEGKQDAENLSVFYNADKKLYMDELVKSVSVMKKKVDALFNDDSELHYIPAGRSIWTLLSNQIDSVSLNRLDYTNRIFFEEIFDVKKLFTLSMDNIVESKIKTSVETVNRINVDFAISQIKHILKGEYTSGNDNLQEGLIIEDGKYVSLSSASSGQQEIVWILNMFFYWILENKKAFVIIEEPEAHLPPTTQRDVMNLVSFFCNATGSKILVTTHSPYILTSLNNLLYADKMGKKNEPVVSKHIDKVYWLSFDKVSAYRLSRFKDEEYIKPIIDRERQEIMNEEIDAVSNILNEEYSNIYYETEVNEE